MVRLASPSPWEVCRIVCPKNRKVGAPVCGQEGLRADQAKYATSATIKTSKHTPPNHQPSMPQPP